VVPLGGGARTHPGGGAKSAVTRGQPTNPLPNGPAPI